MTEKEKRNLADEEIASSASSDESVNTDMNDEVVTTDPVKNSEVQDTLDVVEANKAENESTESAQNEVAAAIAAAGGTSEVLDSAPKRNMAAVWMVVSAVLLIALIFVAVKNPFAKSDEAVATVNGAKITKDALYNAMLDAGGKSTLNGLITFEVINQEAKANNITVTDADLNKEIDSMKESFGSEEAFNQMLTKYNWTLESLRKQMVPQVQLTKLLTPKVSVTDQEIKDYYEQNKESMATPEQVRASHILVKTKAEAEAIVKDLKGGADFAALAKEKSTDPGSKDNGGDLNYFSKGQMVPSFEEAAFKLKVGEISEPVQSDFGYHIIKVTDHKDAVNPTFDQKKDEIKETLTHQKISEMSSSYMDELKAKAKITNTLDKPADEANDSKAKETTTDTTK